MLLNDEDLKRQMPVNESFSHALLLPAIVRVENREIKPLLGRRLYAILDAAYNARYADIPSEAGFLTTEQRALLDFVQPVVANLAMWQYAGKGTMIIDDKGFSVTMTETTRPASETKIEDFKRSCMQAGFDGVDDLIAFLEEHEADYPDWADSEGQRLSRSFFIPSAQVFNEYVNIQASRRMYLLMQPIMRRVERQELMAVTCEGLFEALKSEMQAKALSPAHHSLLFNLRGAVAHLTWSKALNELALTIDDQGIHVMNNTFSGTLKGLQPAEVDRIRVVRESHEQVGRGYLAKLKQWLQSRVEDYPLYQASPCYTQPASENEPVFENQSESGVVFF